MTFNFSAPSVHNKMEKLMRPSVGQDGRVTRASCSLWALVGTLESQAAGTWWSGAPAWVQHACLDPSLASRPSLFPSGLSQGHPVHTSRAGLAHPPCSRVDNSPPSGPGGSLLSCSRLSPLPGEPGPPAVSHCSPPSPPLLASGNLDKQTGKGSTALHYCCLTDNAECLKLLLRGKASIEIGESTCTASCLRPRRAEDTGTVPSEGRGLPRQSLVLLRGLPPSWAFHC